MCGKGWGEVVGRAAPVRVREGGGGHVPRVPRPLDPPLPRGNPRSAYDEKQMINATKCKSIRTPAGF